MSEGYLFVGGPADGKIMAVEDDQPTWMMAELLPVDVSDPLATVFGTTATRRYLRLDLAVAGAELVWSLTTYVDDRLSRNQANDIALGHIMRPWGAKEYRREEAPRG